MTRSPRCPRAMVAGASGSTSPTCPLTFPRDPWSTARPTGGDAVSTCRERWNPCCRPRCPIAPARSRLARIAWRSRSSSPCPRARWDGRRSTARSSALTRGWSTGRLTVCSPAPSGRWIRGPSRSRRHGAWPRCFRRHAPPGGHWCSTQARSPSSSSTATATRSGSSPSSRPNPIA